jgi:serine/threonine protein kinase
MGASASIPSKSEQVTIEAFRPLHYTGTSNFGPICVVERKSDSRLFTIHSALKYKVLRDNTAERCLNEKRLLQGLDHPFIPKLRFAFQNDLYLYLMFDHLDGGNMQLIDKRWTEHEIMTIAAEVASAIKYLHNLRIVHRDIKPKV